MTTWRTWPVLKSAGVAVAVANAIREAKAMVEYSPDCTTHRSAAEPKPTTPSPPSDGGEGWGEEEEKR